MPTSVFKIYKSFCLCEFPHLAFVRGPRSLVLEETMQAAMGAAGESSAGPHAQFSIYVLIVINFKQWYQAL